MNDVPLIQSPDTNSINTSIIAIKKQLRTINEALGLIDIPDAPDLSPYVKKSDVVDTVESGNMNPVTSNAVDNYKTDTVASGNNLPVTSSAVANALKGTVYATGTGAVSKTSGNIRTLSNLPKGVYVVHYGFGYVEANNNYLMFTTTDPQGFCYTSLCLESRVGWVGELTSIAKLPNGGDVSLSMYSSGSYSEQGNGTGLVAVKICDL